MKNQYPTNINRNNYNKNLKRSTIETPLWLAEFIYKKIKDRLKGIKYCIDIGCHIGNLSLPFKKAKYKCFGIDNKKIKYHSTFFKFDFLNMPLTVPGNNCGIVVCNPPFNDEEKKYGKKLVPELFLKQIFELWGNKVPLILFSPMGILKNQKLSSPRWKWIRDCGAEITSELELPIDVYIPKGNLKKYEEQIKLIKKHLLQIYNYRGYKSGNVSYKMLKNKFDDLFMKEDIKLKRKYKIVLVHSSVLFFNIFGLPAKMFLEDN